MIPTQSELIERVADKGDLFRFHDDMPPTLDGKMLVWNAWCAAAKIEARIRAECAAAPLTEPEILERAAKICDRELECSVAGQVRILADSFRATSAPKPVDVFERFGLACANDSTRDIEARARERFGPLVEALEKIEGGSNCPQSADIAEDALSELRRKSSAEGAGTARPKGSERKAQEAGQ